MCHQPKAVEWRLKRCLYFILKIYELASNGLVKIMENYLDAKVAVCWVHKQSDVRRTVSKQDKQAQHDKERSGPEGGSGASHLAVFLIAAAADDPCDENADKKQADINRHIAAPDDSHIGIECNGDKGKSEKKSLYPADKQSGKILMVQPVFDPEQDKAGKEQQLQMFPCGFVHGAESPHNGRFATPCIDKMKQGSHNGTDDDAGQGIFI